MGGLYKQCTFREPPFCLGTSEEHHRRYRDRSSLHSREGCIGTRIHRAK
ncbi:protein UL126 [Cynomolgus macaque cytomegalovirus strain Ottawa]|uniref:Protein UL126 n=1 Tax=macacine betaherpesvirus 8 TaxID=2560567 RepID=G8H0Q4_9BETA|nr:protein UL126 [Cynomolgus macaque cytomegalovirus strain Ottawa]AEQ32252.1 protein UL126 [Cynomolgus macaque cytomegalovirus strain Ottawa]